MAKAKKKAKKEIVPAKIVFETRQIDGENKVFVLSPWPAFAVFVVEAFATSDFVKLDGDELKITVANGTATYEKFSTGLDAKEGEVVFKLVDSTFEPLAGAGQEGMVIDTHAEGEEPYKRVRLSETIAAETRSAMRASDMHRHAGLHALDTAFGEFKRACKTGAEFFPEDSSERAALLEIVDEL